MQSATRTARNAPGPPSIAQRVLPLQDQWCQLPTGLVLPVDQDTFFVPVTGGAKSVTRTARPAKPTSSLALHVMEDWWYLHLTELVPLVDRATSSDPVMDAVKSATQTVSNVRQQLPPAQRVLQD